jgi:gentisate 1,2-dioxygenase
MPVSCSMSIGELAPSGHTSNHRHAYEALVYVVRGRGHSIIEGQRFDWQEGDAFYTPPWCWHQHFASDEGPVQYLTATNMPLLGAIGQTVIRQEASASAR